MGTNSPLAQLIAEYENEVDLIKKEINHCIELSFFKEAEKYNYALNFVTSTLNRL